MITFFELYEKMNEAAPPTPPGPGAGAGPTPTPLAGAPGSGALPTGGPPMPPSGGGGMPMGGPDPLGGLGMGGPSAGAPPQTPPAKQIKPNSVWEILEKILDNKPIEKPENKSSGQQDQSMLQNGQPANNIPNQPSNQPGANQPPTQI